MEYFSNKIAVAWGGGLNVKNIKSNAKYYDVRGIIKYKHKKFYTSRKWSYTETPQTGIVFTTLQSINHGIWGTRMKSGYVKFKLYQTKRKGYETNCVAQYGHKLIGFGSVTITPLYKF